MAITRETLEQLTPEVTVSLNDRTLVLFPYPHMKKTYYGVLITHVEGPIGPLCDKVIIVS